MKLIVFYSYTGNTKSVAQKIQRKLNCDILEINPCIPYSDNYQQVVEMEEEKINQKEMIDIKPINIDLSKYDEIILGTPVWWYTIAPAIRTFLSNNNLNDKKINVFATNGGWIGNTFEEISNYVTINSSLNIKFNQNTLDTNESEIDNWINNL